MKNNAVGRSKLEGPEDLHRAVVSRLRFLQKRPDRVRSFFRAPETCCAAAQLQIPTYRLVRDAQ